MELEGGDGEGGGISVIYTPNKCTTIFTFLLFLFFWQEIQISIAHIKAEILEVFVEGHDLFLWVGVHPPKQCALYDLCRCSSVLRGPLFLKFYLNYPIQENLRNMSQQNLETDLKKTSALCITRPRRRVYYLKPHNPCSFRSGSLTSLMRFVFYPFSDITQ